VEDFFVDQPELLFNNRSPNEKDKIERPGDNFELPSPSLNLDKVVEDVEWNFTPDRETKEPRLEKLLFDGEGSPLSGEDKSWSSQTSVCESISQEIPSDIEPLQKHLDKVVDSKKDEKRPGLLAVCPGQSILSKDTLLKMKNDFAKKVSPGVKRKFSDDDESMKRRKVSDLEKEMNDLQEEMEFRLKSRAAYYIASRLVKGTLML